MVAANTLLLQFFHLFSYFMDGFAYAGEALTGRYVGMQRSDLVQMLVRQLFSFGWPLAVLTSLLYLLVPSPLLHLLSDSPEVVAVALRWVPYIAFVPLLGFAAFLWDGVFVGATYARGLRTSMLVASALFFGFYYLTRASWGVAALWISFDLYYLSDSEAPSFSLEGNKHSELNRPVRSPGDAAFCKAAEVL